MIKGKKKEELTMEVILKKISDYDIYRRYMPHNNWKINQVCISPFPKQDGSFEQNPSFLIGDRKGYLSHILFSNSEYRGDCFNFVKQLYNLSTLDEALRMIDRDFGLGIASEPTGEYKKITAGYTQPSKEKKNNLIQVVTRKFTKEELAYWNQYHQDIDDLRRNHIYSIKKLYLNKRLFYLKDTELRFGYFYDGYWKIYRPFSGKKEKWLPNNVPITALDGKENIKNCHTAFINKSKKDKMVVEKVFSCSMAVQSENPICFSEENVAYIKENSQFQVLSFDADETGVANSQKITEMYGFGYCNVPRKYLAEGIKDWSDLGKAYGLKAVEQVLKEKGII